MNQITMELDRYDAIMAENAKLKADLEKAKGKPVEFCEEPVVDWKAIPYYSISVMSAYQYETLLEKTKMSVQDLKDIRDDAEKFEKFLTLKYTDYGTNAVMEILTNYATTTVKFGIDTYYLSLNQNYPQIKSELEFKKKALFHDHSEATAEARSRVMDELKEAIERIEKKQGAKK